MFCKAASPRPKFSESATNSPHLSLISNTDCLFTTNIFLPHILLICAITCLPQHVLYSRFLISHRLERL